MGTLAKEERKAPWVINTGPGSLRAGNHLPNGIKSFANLQNFTTLMPKTKSKQQKKLNKEHIFVKIKREYANQSTLASKADSSIFLPSAATFLIKIK